MISNNRRRFLQATGVVAAAALAGSTAPAAESNNRKLKLGLASYSLRKFDLDQTLAMTKKVGLEYIAFKSFHLALNSSPAQIKAAVAKVKEAGLKLYGGGVISMKNVEQVNQAFDYARAAGMTVIIGVPAPDLLPLVEQKVKQYNIKVAIHNHGPGDKLYPTPAMGYDKIKGLDRRIGFCHDVGHTKRYGGDPVAQTLKYADRMLDFHIKDVSAASAKGHGCEIGRGVMDIPAVVRAIMKINFDGVVSFEYEKDANDPLAGLAESVGYVRGVIDTL